MPVNKRGRDDQGFICVIFKKAQNLSSIKLFGNFLNFCKYLFFVVLSMQLFSYALMLAKTSVDVNI